MTAFYLLIRNPEQNLPLPELGLSSSKAIDDNLDAVLKDYETTNNEIQRRENTTMIVGSFLIAASLLILANTAVSSPSVTSFFPYAFTSVGLYALWLFVLCDTDAKMSSISYNRLKTIEKTLTDKLGYNFGIHSYLFLKTRGKKDEPDRWIEIRRAFGGMVLLLISVAWLLLSFC